MSHCGLAVEVERSEITKPGLTYSVSVVTYVLGTPLG